MYEIHSLQCTAAYLPTSQVACTQYAVYAFNYGDCCTQCTTFDNGVYTVYNRLRLTTVITIFDVDALSVEKKPRSRFAVNAS